MYLGSLGFCVFLGLLLGEHIKKNHIYTIVFVALVAIFGVRTYYRNIDWQTNHKLWVNTVQVSPNSHNAWNNIGDDYDKLGDLENAVKGFGESYRVKPNYADAYHNQANIFYKMGRLDLSRQAYETALSYSPNLQQTYISLTQIDLTEKRIDLAIQHAQKAVELQPNAISYYLYAFVAAQAGNVDVAIKAANESLRYDPSFKASVDLIAAIRSQT
jgi:tetratricopeptide (TPR) repeat protein